MLQPRLVVSYQQSDQRRALTFAQNVSMRVKCSPARQKQQHKLLNMAPGDNIYNNSSNRISSCLNWKIHCDDHSSLSSMTAVQIYELFHIYLHHFTPYTGRYELSKLTSLPMCGFIAQLVEHRTGITEVTGSNPVEALIFFRLLLSSCLNWKIHCDDHSSLSSMTAVQIYELFHIYLHHFTPYGKI